MKFVTHCIFPATLLMAITLPAAAQRCKVSYYSRTSSVVVEAYISDAVDQQPEFPGGEAAMYKWLGDNIVYPSAASEEGVQGRVVVEFVVGKDGSISNVKVVRPRHPALDKEALRVVKAMPKWLPGRNNGQPVKVTYTLPVTFKLQ